MKLLLLADQQATDGCWWVNGRTPLILREAYIVQQVQSAGACRVGTLPTLERWCLFATSPLALVTHAQPR
jgi:hypothetical protein